MAAVCSGCGSGNEDEGITTGFLEDTVLTVGTDRVSLAEWYLYALPQKGAAETVYGPDIWQYQISDSEGTMADAVKKDILDQIIYIHVVCARAEEFGISLDADELSDIETATIAYMERLTSQQKEKYGISREVVHDVYCDNMLALKVYEHLTLNMDEDIPDEEVRHMVIEYICANKYYEDGDDETVIYSEEELEGIRHEMEELFERAVSDSSITRLSQLGNERYSATSMTVDYRELKERFPSELADIVFNMRENEILGVYDTDEAFFIFDCVRKNDEEATDEARIRIIEDRQKKLFSKQYDGWKKETITKLNYPVWDSIRADDEG